MGTLSVEPNLNYCLTHEQTSLPPTRQHSAASSVTGGERGSTNLSIEAPFKRHPGSGSPDSNHSCSAPIGVLRDEPDPTPSSAWKRIGPWRSWSQTNDSATRHVKLPASKWALLPFLMPFYLGRKYRTIELELTSHRFAFTVHASVTLGSSKSHSVWWPQYVRSTPVEHHCRPMEYQFKFVGCPSTSSATGNSEA